VFFAWMDEKVRMEQSQESCLRIGLRVGLCIWRLQAFGVAIHHKHGAAENFEFNRIDQEHDAGIPL